MEFKKLTLDCIKTLRSFFSDNHSRICDSTLGGTFLWRDYHKTEYTVEGGVLYLKAESPYSAFAPPKGDAKTGREAYERIIEYCGSDSVRMCCVSTSAKAEILQMFPRSIVQTDRAWSDYLYLSDDIKNLAGRKFSGQRNHINRFKRENPIWAFERITQENVSGAVAFIEKHGREHVKNSSAYVEANKKTLEMLNNLDIYEAFGGVLYIGSEAVGVSIGETMGDTLFIHVEKADTDCHGAYPMLMNQFAKMFAYDGIDYINREEDDGVEGLRVSKLSYHPVALLDKYTVEIRL